MSANSDNTFIAFMSCVFAAGMLSLPVWVTLRAVWRWFRQ